MAKAMGLSLRTIQRIVVEHAQQLIFVDERIKEYFFSKAMEVLEKNQWYE